MASPIYFTGRARDAALLVLDNTSLGDRLDNATRDDGTLLEIAPLEDVLDSLSTGERRLYEFIESLAGHGRVNLYALISDVDEDCALRVFWAVGILAGKATPFDNGVEVAS